MGRDGKTNSSGRNSTRPTQRAGIPRGNSNQSDPSSATPVAHNGGACCCQTAHGVAARNSISAINCAVIQCAGHIKNANPGNVASNARGVMTKLTTGIATAFASGDTSENCWNNISSKGIMPTVIAHWARPHCTSQWPEASLPLPMVNNKATAPKDSQNPAASTAHGSSSNTTSSATLSECRADSVRRIIMASATVASM